MTCSSECNEGHTYRPGCVRATMAVDAPTTVMTSRAKQAASLSRQAVAVEMVDRCWNLMCDNVPGDGKFTIYLMWFKDKPHKPFAAPLCAPCAEMLREAVVG